MEITREPQVICVETLRLEVCTFRLMTEIKVTLSNARENPLKTRFCTN